MPLPFSARAPRPAPAPAPARLSQRVPGGCMDKEDAASLTLPAPRLLPPKQLSNSMQGKTSSSVLPDNCDNEKKCQELYMQAFDEFIARHLPPATGLSAAWVGFTLSKIFTKSIN